MSNPLAGATHRFGRLPRRSGPLPTTTWAFAGVATLTTSRPDLRGPYARPVSADVLIDARGAVTVTSLRVGPATLGSVTCTITQQPRTGTGTYVAGRLCLDVGLHFGIDVLRGAQDSDLRLTLSTDAPGSQVTADGRLALAGTATCQAGYLGGRTATVLVEGTISPDAGGVRGDVGPD